jgi:histidinol-phosphate aminotransferase
MPFNVSSLAAAAAEAALDDEEHVQRSKEINDEGREYLTKELEAMDIEVVPSVTNFLLVDMNRDSRTVFEKLQKEGVIVRPMSAFGMPGALRISIGMPKENEALVKALKKVL